MRNITEAELKQMLENHLHWLREDCDGWENMRADLCYADLRYANLCNADLRYANLRNANLRYADLRNADLRNADLCNADLCYANLRNADLCNADLRYAHHLDEATGLYLPTACPSDGAFTGWKKCRDGVIAKLLIPETAKRSSATGRKCRASEAVVLALYDKDGNEVDKAVSQNDADFVYRPGEAVQPTTPFDENRWEECAPGIHFFVTREEAERY